MQHLTAPVCAFMKLPTIFSELGSFYEGVRTNLISDSLLAQTNRQHPPAASYFLGLCTGSFAAAAISCSRTVWDIARVGIQAVIVGFRIGLHVRRKAEILGYPEPSSWSAVIYNTGNMQGGELTDALTRFSIEKVSYKLRTLRHCFLLTSLYSVFNHFHSLTSVPSGHRHRQLVGHLPC